MVMPANEPAGPQLRSPYEIASWLMKTYGFSVIPLDHPDAPVSKEPESWGKKPAIPSWKPYQQVRASEDLLRKWFIELGPRNVAIVTGGFSGVVVIDADNMDAERCVEERLPPTPMRVRTKRGKHYYFRHPGSWVKTTTGVEMFDGTSPGIDIRGDGGLVVAPGGARVGGFRYTEEEPWPSSLDELPLYDPSWFRSRSKPSGTPRAGSGNEARVLHEHQRNVGLTSMAGSMRRAGFGQDAIIAALRRHNRLHCQPPLDDDELSKIAASVAKYPIGAPSPGGASPGSPHLNFSPLDELLDEPDAPVDWLVADRIAVGSLNVLAGKPKAGKSTTGRDLAYAVATGGLWLGHQCRQGKVLYVALEDKRSEVTRHFRVMGATPGLPIMIHTGGAGPAAVADLLEAIGVEQPALVIVDTMQRLIGATDLNDYAEVTGRLDPLIQVARQTGSAVLLVHHAKKGAELGMDGVLGSTAVTGSADTVLLLCRSDRYRVLSTQQRIGPDLPETVITLENGRVGLGAEREEAERDRIQSDILRALDNADAPMTEAELADAITARGALKKRALRELLAKGAVRRTGTGKKGDAYRYESFSGFQVPTNGGEPASTPNGGASSPAPNDGSLDPSSPASPDPTVAPDWVFSRQDLDAMADELAEGRP